MLGIPYLCVKKRSVEIDSNIYIMKKHFKAPLK